MARPLGGSRVCSNCGEALARKAHFCRSCGSDAETGWSAHGRAGSFPTTRLGDDEYQHFLAREFPSRAPFLRRHRQLLMRLVIALVLIAFLLVILR